MAIQMRRGAYAAFDPSKLVPGELAVVLSGDPDVTDGKSLYVCFAAGDVKRVATWEDAAQLIAAELGDAIDMTVTSANGAISVTEGEQGTAFEIAHAAQFNQAEAGLDPVAASSGSHAVTGTSTLSAGGNFWVPIVSVDAWGHVTAVSYRRLTLPQSGGVATASAVGSVKPDGTTTTVEPDGTLHAVHPSHTARTGKPTANQTPTWGETFTVSQVESDAQGHVTGMTDRAVTIPSATATTGAAGLMSASDKSKLDGITPSNTIPLMDSTAYIGSGTDYARGNHRHPTDTTRAPLASPALTGTPTAPTAETGTDTTQIATTAFVQQEIAGKADASDMPTAVSDLTNDAGYLDAEGPFDATKLSGVVPAANLPSYVDDVVEGYLYQGAFYEEAAHATAIAGEAGKIYVDLADDSAYRWSGSAYVSISNPVDFATQAEAEGGVENTKAMTALRTKQAIDANAYTHPTSGATAGSYGDASAQTPAFGGTFKALRETVDANGHVTAVSEHTVTIPSAEATTQVAGLMSASDKEKLDGVASNANAYTHPTSTANGSYGDTSNQTPAWGGTFKATSQTVDASGHVTTAAEHTVTIPSSTATDSAAGLMSAADHAALTDAVADVTNLDARVTSLEHPVLEWDDTAGHYTDESVTGWLGNMRDSLSYGISVPKGSATACTKLGANAGIAVPVPGIVGRAAVDPYAELGPFRHFDVNGYVDADGTPHVTAIQGDGNFKRDGTNGDVWVLAPVLWWSIDTSGDAVEIYVSDTRLAGMSAQPQAYLPDGSPRPFMLYAKYAGSNDGNGMMASVSGAKPWNRNVSHDSLITQCKTATMGYSGKSIADDWYLKVMFLIKYATKNSQSVLAGCTSYNYQYSPAVAETGVTRVILTDAQAANLLVGSAMMLGTHAGSNPGNDRGTGVNYNVFDGLAVSSIETYASGLKAVNFDTTTTFDTDTTYLLSTSPWHTGSCDAVEGDGSPTNPTSGKEPFVLQGIETAVGLYEVLGDVIVSSDGSTGWEICVCKDSRNESTSVTSNYTHTGKYLYSDSTDSWKYPLYPDSADGVLFGAGYGASQSTGMCDGSYTNKTSTSGTREWRGLGHLIIGALAGLWCVLAHNGLTHARWYIGSRLSATGRALAA